MRRKKGISDFHFNLDIDSLSSRRSFNSFRHFVDFAGAVDRGMTSGMKEVAEKTAKRIQEKLVEYGLGDSSLSGDIVVVLNDTTISITVDNDYYMFVEFGTGIVGQKSHNKNKSHSFIRNHGVAWEFDTKSHGESGWWYPSSPDDPNPSLYMSYDGSWWAWTKGQESKPFMHDGWMYASMSSYPTVNNHIIRELRKLEGKSG